MNLKHIYWKYFGYPDLPPKSFKIQPKMNQYTDKFYFPRHYIMANMYVNGFNLKEIAEHYNVTRERVRQCIWKCYWDLHRN